MRRFESTAATGSTFAALLILIAVPLEAFEGRLLLREKRPAAGFQVAIAGQAGSVRADEQGRFRLERAPEPPFTLVVIGNRGEIYDPIVVTDSASRDFVLKAGYGETLTITSGVTPNILAAPAAAKVLVGQEELEERHPPRLVDALASIAGVSRIEEGASGVPVVRGLARGRTLIILDEMRVTAERRAGPSATFLDPFTIGSIEIARGPGSVAYGSDAFGGVVHVRPRDPERGPPRVRFDASVTVGGVDEKTLGLDYSQNLGGGCALLMFHGRDFGESEAGGGAPIHNSSAGDFGAALRYARDGQLGRLRASIAADRGTDIGKPATDSKIVRAYYPRETSQRLTAGWDAKPLGGWQTIEIDAAVNGYRLVLDRDRFATPAASRRIERSDVDARDASIRLVASRPLGRGLFTSGYDFSSRFGLHAVTSLIAFDSSNRESARTSDVSVDDAARDDTGLFVIYETPVGKRVAITSGLRGDRVSSRNSDGFFGDRQRRDNALSGQIASSMKWSDALTTTLQFSRGFRVPTLSDRFFRGPTGRGFVTGNPDLRPECSKQVDLLVRWSAGQVVLSGSIYRYEIEQLIERFRQGDNFFFRNRGEARLEGAELEAFVALPRSLSFQFAASTARGDVLGSGEALGDLAPPTVQTTLRWAGSANTVYGRVIAVQRKTRPGPTERQAPGYAALDLGFTRKLPRDFEMRLLLRNAGDRRYLESYDEKGAFAPGRAVTVGLLKRL